MLLCVPFVRSCCFAPLAWCVALHSSCSKLLFYSSCLTWCFAPFLRFIAPHFLFDLLFHSLGLTYCYAPLAQPLAHVLFFYTRDFLVPFLQCCYSCSFCFRLVFPPFTFLQAWSVEEMFKFEFFKLDLEGENFCFQFLFVDEVF